MSIAYRAAYLVAPVGSTSGGIALTGPEHAGLGDADLIAAALPALAEHNSACRAIGEDEADESEIIIGEWTE